MASRDPINFVHTLDGLAGSKMRPLQGARSVNWKTAEMRTAQDILHICQPDKVQSKPGWITFCGST